MQCRTTNRGVPCSNEAHFIVSGFRSVSGYGITAHPTCKRCARAWQRIDFTELRPIGQKNAGSSPVILTEEEK
jgi:hypothetical protein